MQDWLRSLTVLGLAFTTVVAVTIALATVIVPNRVVSSHATESTAPGATGPAVGRPEVLPAIPGLGGTLQVTGDREGAFDLTRESLEGRYSLVGNDGRIAFEGRPLQVAQISYEGWEFFPDPGECTVTPGNLDNRVGIGFAELRCNDLADIRDNGVITIAGTIGLPLDLLADSDLPESGGSVAVGDETWQFAEATLATWPSPVIGGHRSYNMELVDRERGGALNFDYDQMTHALTLATVARGDADSDVPAGACALAREQLGRLNPRTTVVELTIDCPAVDVPGLGVTSITGTVVVDELQWPE